MKLLKHALLLFLVVAVAACGTMGKGRSPRDQILYDYTSALRWSEYEVALTFVDPFVREAEPLSALELERYKQLKVSGYEVKRSTELADGSLQRTVEIRVVNNHTLVERTVTVEESWRFDTEAKRWWLVSGLPDLSPQ